MSSAENYRWDFKGQSLAFTDGVDPVQTELRLSVSTACHFLNNVQHRLAPVLVLLVKIQMFVSSSKLKKMFRFQPNKHHIPFLKTV